MTKCYRMQKKRLYIYPLTSRGMDDAQNPYIYNLCDHLKVNYEIVNIQKPSNKGIIQIMQMFWHIDVLYFNWIENLPDRKAGKIQVFLFIAIVYLSKVFNKTIIWTMHNKVSHNKKNYAWKLLLFKLMLKKSDIILTHSREGIDYGKKMGGKSNIYYFPHPVLIPNDYAVNSTPTKEYDIFIWGLMAPYKGLSFFLQYLNEQNIVNYRILIAGKFVSNEYYNEITKYKTDNITIINEFLDKQKIREYAEKSSVVLFTYKEDSVLSSGVLSDSLLFNTTIIGPDTGSFADLKEDGIIETYKNFDDLINILNNRVDSNMNNRIKFINKITWEAFGKFVDEKLKYC